MFMLLVGAIEILLRAPIAPPSSQRVHCKSGGWYRGVDECKMLPGQPRYQCVMDRGATDETRARTEPV